MRRRAQGAQAAAADAPDNVSAVLAVVESMEHHAGTLGNRPTFRVERELVAHLAAHVSRECVAFVLLAVTAPWALNDPPPPNSPATERCCAAWPAADAGNGEVGWNAGGASDRTTAPASLR